MSNASKTQVFKCEFGFSPESNGKGVYGGFISGDTEYLVEYIHTNGIRIVNGGMSVYVTNDEVAKYGKLIEATPINVSIVDREDNLNGLIRELQGAHGGVILSKESTWELINWITYLQKFRAGMISIDESLKKMKLR